MKELSENINALSYEIIGAALEVHRTLGPGLLESVYENALCIEFDHRNIRYEQQKPIVIEYKGHSIGSGRVDLLVDDLIIVELKSVEKTLPIHQAQVMTYLKLTDIRLGLLINFNTTLLKNEIKRIAI